MLSPWLLGMRPKTLTAAAAPVAVGAALAFCDGVFALLPSQAALAGALLIQIGTNLANDVLDYRRGIDDEARLGPTRVVQAGLLPAGQVTAAAAGAFALAAALGLYLVHVSGWPILVVGVAAIVSGVLYTAGPVPLAYVGLADMFVLVFFGLAAVAGTYYVQALTVTPASLAYGVAVGALSVAILNVNNLRDIDTDRRAGKRSLAVRLGAPATRTYYAASVLAAFAVPWLQALSGDYWLPALFSLLALPDGLKAIGAVRGGAKGRELNPVLGQTARLQAAHALLLSVGLVAESLLYGA